jgi:hypothetical protein
MMKAGDKILVKVFCQEGLYEVSLGEGPYYGGLSVWDDGDGFDMYLNDRRIEDVWVHTPSVPEWARALTVTVGRRLVKLGLAKEIDCEPGPANLRKIRAGVV